MHAHQNITYKYLNSPEVSIINRNLNQRLSIVDWSWNEVLLSDCGCTVVAWMTVNKANSDANTQSDSSPRLFISDITVILSLTTLANFLFTVINAKNNRFFVICNHVLYLDLSWSFNTETPVSLYRVSKHYTVETAEHRRLLVLRCVALRCVALRCVALRCVWTF